MTERKNKILNREMNWVRLPLENAANVRELGGYPVQDGGQTAYRRFLRADDLSLLSDADVQFLLDYPVRMVIDLRSEDEALRSPDRLENTAGVTYVRIPYLGRDLTDAMKISAADIALGLGALYTGMIENKSVTGEIFEAINNAPEGCILFHCTAGKDRTGVLAMLLMSLAGADKQDCMTNYAQSYVNLTRKVEFSSNSLLTSQAQFQAFMTSLPETIATCYDHVMEKYGSTENYLRECGLNDGQLNRIKQRLLSDI